MNKDDLRGAMTCSPEVCVKRVEATRTDSVHCRGGFRLCRGTGEHVPRLAVALVGHRAEDR